MTSNDNKPPPLIPLAFWRGWTTDEDTYYQCRFCEHIEHSFAKLDKHIRVSAELIAELKKRGQKGETYEDIIRKMLQRK